MRTFFGLIPAVLLTLLLPVAGGAELRSFTLDNGQTAKATLAGVTGNQVSLILEDGRQVSVDMNRLSKVDQVYIQNTVPGAKLQPPAATPVASAAPSSGQASPGSVKLAWTKNRIGDKVQATNKNVLNAPKTETWKCQFELANSSRLRLENLNVQYKVFFHVKSRTGGKSKSNSYSRTVTGILKVPALDGFQSLKVETPEMRTTGSATQVLAYDPEARRYYDSGVRNLSMEEIEGVVVTVTQNGSTVLRYVSPGIRDTEGP